jgi:hypothetical protein
LTLHNWPLPQSSGPSQDTVLPNAQESVGAMHLGGFSWQQTVPPPHDSEPHTMLPLPPGELPESPVEPVPPSLTELSLSGGLPESPVESVPPSLTELSLSGGLPESPVPAPDGPWTSAPVGSVPPSLVSQPTTSDRPIANRMTLGNISLGNGPCFQVYALRSLIPAAAAAAATVFPSAIFFLSFDFAPSGGSRDVGRGRASLAGA